MVCYWKHLNCGQMIAGLDIIEDLRHGGGEFNRNHVYLLVGLPLNLPGREFCNEKALDEYLINNKYLLNAYYTYCFRC